MGTRAPDRDRLHAGALHGTAWRLAAERGSLSDAVDELRRVAAGRNDLLAEAAGLVVGSWSVRPAMHVGTELFVAGILIAAGSPLDYDKLARWVVEGQQRGLRAVGHAAR